MRVEFWFDVVCPFAYLAATRAAAVAAEAGAELVWRPILLGGLLRDHGVATDPNEAMPEAKRRWVRADVARQAAWLGEPLTFPDAHPRRTVSAMRLLTAAPAERVPALAAALYRAYWVEGRDIADRDVLRAVADRFEVPLAAVDDPAVKERLRAATSEAASRGVFGVPTFTVGRQRFWGVDRLDFVRQALSDLGLGSAQDLGLQPEARAVPRRPGGQLEFFHDLASPFSYLASTQVEALAKRAGASLQARPILVGALFTAIGTPLVPMATFSAAKQSYLLEDLERWAARWGVPFRFPSTFPIRTIVANRVVIAEPATAAALYRAAWAEDQPISEAHEVRRVLDAAGFDGPALLARAEAPEIKAQLRANTDAAQAAGVCGVPTLLARRTGEAAVLFWGQDRLDQVEHFLGGA